jgi:hypothetical protein
VHGLGVPEGHRLVEWRSCVSVDPWLDFLGRGVVQQNGDLCMCGSLAWQALGAQV